MTKRIFALSAAIILLFAGCSRATPHTEVTPTTAPTATTTTTEAAVQPLTEDDFVLSVNGTDFRTEDPAQSLLNTLGEPAKTEEWSKFGSYRVEAGRCYIFDAMLLYAVDMDGAEYIDSFRITDKQFATQRGLTVGCTRDEVRKVYGTPTSDNPQNMIYAMNFGRVTVDGVERDVQHTLTFSFPLIDMDTLTYSDTAQDIHIGSDYYFW